MKWYPLTFKPIYKEKIWGGANLNRLKSIEPPIDKLGESWELCDVDKDISIVQNGGFQGKSLQWLLQNEGEDLMGATVYKQFGNQFPLLIKYIDAAEDLSIQLHPDNATARANHASFGKTEVWYIMETQDGAQLTLGFKEDVDKNAFAEAIQNKTLTTLLNTQEVKPGEGFFIKPGFVHAIGAGITLAEIQQSSDVTYRVYDYDRKDDQGITRDLHVEEFIAIADYSKAQDYKLNYSAERKGCQELIKTDYFDTHVLQFDKQFDIPLSTGKSFTILMNVGESCSLVHEDKTYEFNRAQTYLIPSALKSLEVTCLKKGKLLLVHL